jgi:hypothetical protein
MEEFVFRPVRRGGTVFQAIFLALFIFAGLVGFWQAFQANIGPVFLFWLLPVLVSFAVVPVLAYRFYALQQATYTLEREGIRLRWGLRMEEIPIANVLWVNRASQLSAPLPLPRLHWPGGLLGRRHLAGAGEIEFMASSPKDLVVIATTVKYFAVSPENPETFLLAFQRCIEMGSLFPLQARSVYPTVLLIRVWQSKPARALLLGGGLLSLALLVWVSLAIPGQAQLVFGFRPEGVSGDIVPAVQLLLLPILNTFFFLTDFFLGLFYFRKEESQSIGYLFWAAGALTPLLFLLAVWFILQAS